MDKNSTESYAKTGYDAYGDKADWKNFSGGPMPTWEDLPQDIRDKWEVATQAILECHNADRAQEPYPMQRTWAQHRRSFETFDATDLDVVNDLEGYRRMCQDREQAEKAAKADLARRLRQFADLVEAPGYPDVFDVQLPETDPPCQKLMDHISVTVSHPWPG